MASYDSIQKLHQSLPAFQPYIPAAALPYPAFVLLVSTFVLAFYFSTLPKATVPVRELGVAAIASVLSGFGVVFLFCSVGVNV
ncbi:hypothetical protein M422DRAFT_251377 [Sphaerobolus stellatus SS14]|uniref:Dolichyl-diphosphooligosaccharide-protein glycosyltransferase subunit OST5 n=1 Tax=Sphaerobolus stellatus (strain SS14) TaxID=990650 RepID=A0A0C9VRX7_SPHS4|nr:hypothetical protein M422DRAFT_251377 [Sphaerobolus stellatus SS14]